MRVSDKEIIQVIENLIQAREEFKNVKIKRVHIKEVDVYRWKSYFLIAKATSQGKKLSINDVMRLLKIPQKYKRSIYNFLCQFELIYREKEETVKIQNEFVPMGKSKSKKTSKRKPAYLHGIDMEAVRRVLEIQNTLDKKTARKLFDLIGLTKPMEKFYRQIFRKNKDEFVRFFKEISDALQTEIPPKPR